MTPSQKPIDLGQNYGTVTCLNENGVNWDSKYPPWTSTSIHGLCAGLIMNYSNRYGVHRDLIKHPSETRRYKTNGSNQVLVSLLILHKDLATLKDSNVVTFIPRCKMPRGKIASYARYVVDYQLEKDKPWRLRITCGGNKLDYYRDTTTPVQCCVH